MAYGYNPCSPHRPAFARDSLAGADLHVYGSVSTVRATFPNVFTTAADFLAWVLYCAGVSVLIHYLDDYLVFVPPGQSAEQSGIVYCRACSWVCQCPSGTS